MLKTESLKNYYNYYHLYNKSKLNNFCQTKYTIIHQTFSAQLRLYPATSDKTYKFFIIPSIINNLTIFDIPNKSFINFLQQSGEVYVIEWLAINDNNSPYNFNMYVLEIGQILTIISAEQSINLIGYCLGGNLAIAAAVMFNQQIKSLMLLATPYDFSYLVKQVQLLDYTNISRMIKYLPVVPAFYLQMLFFLLDTDKTLAKFFQPITNNSAEFFVIEQWLYSTNDITKPAYQQLFDDFIRANKLYNNNWFINNQCINPTVINVPVLTLLGTKDKIVAASAVRALYSKLQNSQNIEINAGHIGFFAGKYQQQTFMAIKTWIEKTVYE